MLFIDTDPGVDDALAILMAHARAPGVAGLGIAAGNVGLHHTTANALKLVELLGVSTPVFPGAPQPLVRRAADAAFVHGADGFGDTGYLPARRAAHNEHAALALLRLSHAHAGELVLVALGPLTNLALALSLDPQLPSRVARLVVMGGAVTGQGNASVAAEFNFRFDPEAAHIVFSRWPRFDLVDWELTLRHALDFERFEHWLAGGDARAAFFAAISRKARAFNRAQRRPGIGAHMRALRADQIDALVQWLDLGAQCVRGARREINEPPRHTRLEPGHVEYDDPRTAQEVRDAP